jgi:flagellar M-ring protein FliF
MMMATAIVFVSAAFMIFMVSGTDYVPLFTDIPGDQTSVIMQKLQARNIAFKIENGGKTILIPRELLSSTQMAMMAEIGNSKIGNLGSGLELFDKQDFGATSYAQRITYQRALQGELVRAINTLDAVKQSKVILALPPKKTFLEESSPPTASVVVELNNGKTLSEDQVRGITFLVSSAVEGLEAEKVTVVDSRGKLLSRPRDSESSASNELAETQQKEQHELEEKVESILSKVVGQGKVIARVDLVLNNQSSQISQESVDPDQTAVQSTQTEEEALDGSRTNPTGIPGARANLPGADDNGKVGFNQNVKKGSAVTNYVVPKTVKNIKESAGARKRVSIAVLVDGVTTMEKNEKGEEKEVYKARSPEEMAKLEEIVKSSIGFDPKNGDVVKLENIQFQKEDFSDVEKMLTTLERKKLLNALLKWALLGAGLAMFFFIVVRPFMRWITDNFQDSVEDMLPRTIEELEELQSVDNTLPGMSSALPVLEESLDPDKAESDLLKDRIMALMDKDEEKAAGAFSLWLVRRDT